ncbi:MAG: LysR family transcriptional regulator [Dysgonamonadaceae bacterium]|jgi:LysR family hydrogen peroxide-inducible transcriptional activator|nr:LysR family transcriptional regulator [Dysgonamonadaceae bacterium]
MNIQQLEYIIAVDNYRHFAKAAEASFITQPTLSMMIQKLEDELDVKIFDRTSHPTEPTACGKKIIEQARTILKQIAQIKEIVQEEKDIIRGTFTLGIIPTVAPYIIPDLLRIHEETNSSIQLIIKEMNTAEIIKNIHTGNIDGGLLATPLNQPKITEYPIYYEKFYAYISPSENIYAKQKIKSDDLKQIKNIWLLEDVHCFRNQTLKLCQFSKKQIEKSTATYQAGSIDTLINIVDNNQGVTVIPELAAMKLSEDQQDHLRDFEDMIAVREISLAVHFDFIRQRMMTEIIHLIKKIIPSSMQDTQLKTYTLDL